MPTYTDSGVNYSYTVGTGVASVDVSSSASGDITILPSFVVDSETYNVTSIGDYAFQSSGLTSVTIPASVTSVADFAFQGTGLKNITAYTYISNFYTVFLDVNSDGLQVTFDYVGEIPGDACNGKNLMTGVTIGQNITSILSGAFAGTVLTSVTIPDSVTSIGPYVFQGTGLTSVTIPNYVTDIGSNAFNGCSSLTSVTLPVVLQSIGSYAFYSCSNLLSITIPASVTSVGDAVFQGCSSLTNITTYAYISNFNNVFNVVNNAGLQVIFDYIGEIPEGVFTGKNLITMVTIGENITRIGNNGFKNCSSLTSVTIPMNVTSIGNNAFQGCSSLTNITLPSGLQSIGDYAFYNCTNLPNVTIPNNVTVIGDHAFQYCSQLLSVTIPASVTSVANYAFQYCSSLTNITTYTYISNFNNVFSNVNNAGLQITFDYTGEIPENVCNGKNLMTSVTIGQNITSILSGAFAGTGLRSVTIPQSVTSIGSYVFQGTGLTSVTIPNYVTNIGSYMFQNCSGLTSVAIPDSVTSIGAYAFQKTGLTSITIFDSITSISDYAFQYCSSLTNITAYAYISNFNNVFSGVNNAGLQVTFDYAGAIPLDACSGKNLISGVTIGQNITSILNGAFSSTGLKSVTIPNNVTSIGDYAFSGLGLTSVTIPNSVTSVGDFAFQSCSSLTNITTYTYISNFYNVFIDLNSDGLQVTFDYTGEIPGDACNGKNLMTGVTIGQNITNILSGAFAGTGLTSVTIPNSVTSIGPYVFEGSGLISVTIPNNVTSIGDNTFNCANLTSVTFLSTTIPSIGSNNFTNTNDTANVIPGIDTSSLTMFSSVIENVIVPSPPTITSVTGNNVIVNVYFTGSAGNTISYSINNGTYVDTTQTTSPLEIPTTNFTNGQTYSIAIKAHDTTSNLYSDASNTQSFTYYNSVNYTYTVGSTVASVGVSSSASGAVTILSSFVVDSETYNVTSIGDYAFQSSGLTSVTIPASVTSVADYAFQGTGLKNITVYTYISNFYTVFLDVNNDGLQVTFDYVGEIPGDACNGKNLMTGVTIGQNITSILSGAFAGTVLTSVAIPDSVTSIGPYVFQGTGLTSVTMGQNITSIGDFAFQNCSGLTSVTIPASVTIIGNYAFDCANLTSVIFLGTIPTIGTDNFTNASDTAYVNPATNSSSLTMFSTIIPPNSPTITSVTGNNVIVNVYFTGSAGNAISYKINDGEYVDTTKTTSPLEIPTTNFTDGETYSITIKAHNITSNLYSDASNTQSFTYNNTVNYTYIVGSGIATIGVSSSASGAVSILSRFVVNSITYTVTSIYDSAFQFCNDLTSVIIPNSVRNIRNGAFNSTGLTSVTIPNSVTNIGIYCFFSCPNLTSVTIPNSVRIIDDSAFASTGLTSVIIPDSVRNIRDNAFNSTSLTSVTIPASVTSIGLLSFQNCQNLTSVVVNSANTYYSSVSGVLFNKNITVLIQFPNGLGGSYTIPNTVTLIKNGAFSDSLNLTTVTIPSSVTNIENYAFGNYTDFVSSITNVTFLGAIPTIGSDNFTNDSDTVFYSAVAGGINSSYVTGDNPSDLSVFSTIYRNTYIDENNVQYTYTPVTSGTGSASVVSSTIVSSSLLHSFVLNGLTYNVTSISGSEIQSNADVTSVVIPNTVTIISDNAFKGYTNLTSVTFEATSLVASIGNQAFQGCTGLHGIIIPDSVTTIGSNAFDGSTTLSSVTIGSGVTIISSSVFKSCVSLISIVIPTGIRSIGSNAFQGTGLRSVTIPNTVTSTNLYAFDSCASLTSVTFTSTSTLSSIGQNMFSGCAALSSVTIPNSVLSVGASAFQGCSGLTSAVIGSGVTSIGASAFNCANLTSVRFLSAYIPTIGTNNFTNMNDTVNLEPLANPSSLTMFSTIIGGLIPPSAPTITSITGNNVIVNVYFTGSAGNAISYSINNGTYVDTTQTTTPLELAVINFTNGQTYSIAIKAHNIDNDLYSTASNTQSFTYNNSVIYTYTVGSTDAVVGVSSSASGAVTILPSFVLSGVTYNVSSIGESAFYDCSNLTSVTIPNSVRSIGIGAFQGTGLISITIPSSVTSIANTVFFGCLNLTSVVIPNSVTIIGTNDDNGYVFYGCSKLDNVTLSSNLTYMSGRMFASCSSLTSITIPSSVTVISRSFCYGCSSLTSVVFQENSQLQNIGRTAFASCSSLSSITIPSSVTNINLAAFQLSGLTRVTIPTLVRNINDLAFDLCAGLTSAVIGSGVTNIGASAFNCANLTSVRFFGTIPTIGTSNFTKTGGIVFYDAVTGGVNATNVTGANPTALSVFTTIYRNTYQDTNNVNYTYTPVTSGTGVASVGVSTSVSGAVSILSSFVLNGLTYNVTSISASAFLNKSGLTSITIPNSITFIGDSAFSGTNLTNISIPSSVTSIGSSVFLSCQYLQNISVDINNSSFSSLDGVLFSKDQKTLITYPIANSQKSYTIPDSVTLVNRASFISCSGLTNVIIGSGVTVIDSYAFQSTGLTSIIIPKTVTTIGNYAFDCANLTTVRFFGTIPTIGTSNFTKTGDIVFYDAVTGGVNASFTSANPSALTTSFTTIYRNTYLQNNLVYTYTPVVSGTGVASVGVSASASGAVSILSSFVLNGITYNVTTVGANAFKNCSTLTSVVIPTSVTGIGASSFQGCTSLKNLTIPDSVIIIDSSAFYNDGGLTSVTIGSGVTSIGAQAFNYCSNITSLVINSTVLKIIDSYAFGICYAISGITIPESVVTIGSNAFLGARLTSITIPNSVTTIGDSAFNSTGLTSVTIGSGIKTIGTGVFQNCSKLSSVTIPNSVTTIGTSTFQSSSLTSVTFGSGMTTIGDSAFKSTGLTNVTIGSSVTTISANAFSSCLALTSVTIPNSINYINSNTFYLCSNLLSVTIPNSVTTIAYGAFYNCYALSSVTIGSGVKNIVDNAFYNCYSLVSVDIPNSVTSMGGSIFGGSALTTVNIGSGLTTGLPGIFDGCLNLQNINIDANNQLYSSIDGVSFNKTQTQILFYPAAHGTTFTIPNSVTSINDGAFAKTANLTSITIPNSVVSIGISAFLNSGLSSVTIPNTITTISYRAFYVCPGLTSVTIPNSVTTINEQAFIACNKLTSVIFEQNSPLTYIGPAAFSECPLLTSIIIPKSVTKIDHAAFNNCPALSSVAFEATSALTNIGSNAFTSCRTLQNITIPSTVTYIGDETFNGCSLLSNIVIPDSVTYLGGFVFQNCSALTSVVVGSGVTSIYYYTFAGCSLLTNVIIGSSVAYIGSSAFSTCVALSNISFPNSLINIDSDVFYGCSSLTKIVIPNSVTTMGSNVFGSCVNVTSVVIGSALNSISNNTFAYCYALTSVFIGSAVTSIGNNAFQNCNNLTKVRFFGNMPTIGTNNFTKTGDNVFYEALTGGVNSSFTTTTPPVLTSNFTNIYRNTYLDDNNVQYTYTPVTSGSSVASVVSSTIGLNTVLSSFVLNNITYNVTGINNAQSNIDITTIKNVILPSFLTNIDANTFKNYTGLTSITIPDSVKIIGANAFQFCTALTSVIFTPTSTLITIGESAFDGCFVLTNIDLPITVTSIGAYAFQGCSVLTNIVIPNTLTSIGASAFQGCSVLTNIVIPNTLTSIGASAFKSCSLLASVSFATTSSVQTIAAATFDGCLALKTLTIPNSVTSIGSSVFNNSGLTSVNIGSGVTVIDYYAFKSCLGLQNIFVDGNNTTYSSIDGVLFNKNQKILVFYSKSHSGASYTIPSSVTSIEPSAFNNPTALVNIEIPSSVITIGIDAFNCSNLTKVRFFGAIPTIGTGNFTNVSDSVFYHAVTGGVNATYATGANPTALSVFSSVYRNTYIDENNVKYTYTPITSGTGDATAISSTIGSGEVLHSFVLNGLTYNVTSITGDAQSSTSVTSLVIPNSVTIISDNAFKDYTNLTSVTFEANSLVASIGNQAFQGCTGLKGISIPNSVTSIGSNAFDGCTTLSSVTIGSGVTVIGSSVFKGCGALSSVVIPTGVISIGSNAFQSTGLRTVTIPNSVTNANLYAFDSCVSLTSVTFTPTSTITSIGQNMFSGCSALSSVTIPSSVTTIGASAFQSTGLTSIVIPNLVTTIGASAFKQTLLQTITIPNLVTSIGANAFQSCNALTNAFIGSSVTTIGDYAFNCSYLTTVRFFGTIPTIGTNNFTNTSDTVYYDAVAGGVNASFTTANPSALTTLFMAIYRNTYMQNNLVYTYTPVTSGTGVATISGIHNTAITSSNLTFLSSFVLNGLTYNVRSMRDFALSNQSRLLNVTIPDGVNSISNYAFYACTNLTSVTIPSSVQNIGNNAFQFTSLSSIDIPNLVTSIGNNAFQGCSLLTSVTIPNSLQSIGSLGFFQCSRLKSIILPTNPNFTIIRNHTFFECSSLTSISIPSSVQSIGEGAFYTCSSLPTITIPSTIQSIGPWVFQSCTGFTSITIPSSIQSIGEGTFFQCSNLTNITIPSSVQSIGANVFFQCAALSSVTIPASVTSIGNSAFDCANLTKVRFYGAIPTIGTGNFTNVSDSAFYDAITGGVNASYVSGSNPTALSIFSTIYRNTYIDTNNVIYTYTPVTSGSRVASVVSSTIGSSAILHSFVLNGLTYNVTTISGTETQSNAGVTSVVIPNTVTIIDDNAFKGYTNLTSVTFEATSLVTSIGNQAFKGCTGLKGIIIPDSVTTIGSNAFDGSTTLTSVIIGSGVTVIGSSAFKGCGALSSVVIPTSVRSIGSNAFQSTSLTSVTIPNAVTNANLYTFDSCVSLTSVVFTSTSTLSNIGQNMFSGCAALSSVTIPNSVTTVGSSAFQGCAGLISVVIGYGVTSIANNTFNNCSSLQNINIDSNNMVYSSIDGVLFNKIQNTLLLCPTLHGSSYIIPNSVTFIGENAFIGYNSTNSNRLTSVTITASVTTINNGAFNGCDGLTNIEIPISVATIGADAFNCSNLTKVRFFGAIPTIDSNNFTNASDTVFYNAVAGGINTTNVTGANPSALSVFSTIYRNTYIDTNNVKYTYTPVTSGTGSASVVSSTIGSSSLLHSFVLNGLTYNVSSISGSEIQSNAGVTSVVIPNTVTIIDDNAFKGYTNLTSVTFEATSLVSSIGNQAFQGCTGLQGIIIPDSVTSIGSNAFDGSTTLSSVTIGSGVTVIGSSAFKGCIALTSVVIPTGVRSVGSNAFQSTGLTSVTIPNAVTNANLYTFDNCVSLTSVTFTPTSTITSIGQNMFSGCSGLKIITIPNSVISVDASAFQGCSGLTNAVIGSGVTSIGANAFDCSSLTTVRFFGSIPSVASFGSNNFTKTGDIVFYDAVTGGVNANFKTLNPPVLVSNFTTIYRNTYIDANNVNYIYTPVTSGSGSAKVDVSTTGSNVVLSSFVLNGLTYNINGITSTSTQIDTSVTSFAIPSFVTSVDASAFKGFSNLTAVDIPDSVTSIGANAFENSGLHDIILPDSVVSISADAFKGCASMTVVVIPVSVTSIAPGAFEGCVSLRTVSVPSYVTIIDDSVFSGCSNLTSVLFSVTTDVSAIGPNAFKDCVSLLQLGLSTGNARSRQLARSTRSSPPEETISIPDGVTTIDDYAFSGASNIKNVVIPNTVTNIGQYAFQGCNSLTSVVFTPTSRITTIGANAFQDCSVLPIIIIPASVTTINDDAFQGCSVLTSVTFLGVIPTIGSNNFMTNMNDVAYYSAFTGGVNSSYVSVDPVSLTNQFSIVYRNYYTYDNINYITVGNTAIVVSSPNASGDITILRNISVNGSQYTVTGVGDSAFQDNTNLLSVTMPTSLLTIGDNAFNGCSGLSLVRIPILVASIGSGAFNNCSNLAKVYFNQTVMLPTLGANAFALTVKMYLTKKGLPNEPEYYSNYTTALMTVPQDFYIVDDFNCTADGVTAARLDGAATDDVSGNYPNKAEIFVSKSVVQELFQYWTDSIDMNDVSANDILYRVYYDASSNSTVPLSPHFVSGAIVTSLDPSMNTNPYNLNRRYLPQDYLRYIALQLFNTTKGVDLFANEEEVLMSVNNQCRVALNARLNALTGASAGVIVRDADDFKINMDSNSIDGPGQIIAGTADPTTNPSKKILRQIMKNDAQRLKDISGNMFDTDASGNWYKMPFVAGDKLYFPVTIQAPINQQDLTLKTSPINDRTYLIKCIVTDNIVNSVSYNAYTSDLAYDV